MRQQNQGHMMAATTNLLGLSDAAARRVQELIAADGRDNLKMRVFIRGGGCSGFQYGFSFDQVQEDDLEVSHCGVSLLVDPLSLQYLQGAQVDYIDDLQGARFVVENPNASATCGCGSSFSI